MYLQQSSKSSTSSRSDSWSSDKSLPSAVSSPVGGSGSVNIGQHAQVCNSVQEVAATDFSYNVDNTFLSETSDLQSFNTLQIQPIEVDLFINRASNMYQSFPDAPSVGGQQQQQQHQQQSSTFGLQETAMACGSPGYSVAHVPTVGHKTIPQQHQQQHAHASHPELASLSQTQSSEPFRLLPQQQHYQSQEYSHPLLPPPTQSQHQLQRLQQQDSYSQSAFVCSVHPLETSSSSSFSPIPRLEWTSDQQDHQNHSSRTNFNENHNETFNFTFASGGQYISAAVAPSSQSFADHSLFSEPSHLPMSSSSPSMVRSISLSLDEDMDRTIESLKVEDEDIAERFEGHLSPLYRTSDYISSPYSTSTPTMHFDASFKDKRTRDPSWQAHDILSGRTNNDSISMSSSNPGPCFSPGLSPDYGSSYFGPGSVHATGRRHSSSRRPSSRRPLSAPPLISRDQDLDSYEIKYDSTSGRYRCDSCDMTSERHHNVKSHIKRKHLNERDYQCGYLDCGQGFASKGEWKRHRGIHEPNNRMFNNIPCGHQNCHNWFPRMEQAYRHRAVCKSTCPGGKCKHA